MRAFYGRILNIDLSSKKYTVEEIKDEIFEKYLGGKGLASYLLFEFNPPGVDPMDPANCLIFATGPITGSNIWGSSRYGVFTKSPQTGFYSESYAGGKVPEAIDATGYDAIVIRGRSAEPTILAIYPDSLEFHDADDIWGMETYDTEDEVAKRFGRSDERFKKSGAVVIGPAGENGVCFSVIENDYWRSAGRTGVGAVMGSKKLKAILFEGDRRRELYDETAVREIYRQMAQESKDNAGVKAYKAMGTTQMVKVVNNANAFPTRYWSLGKYDQWEKISSDALHERCDVKPNSCLKCFMGCGRMTTVKEGRHAGLRIEGPEYETICSFGGLCLIDSIEEIVYLNDICDRLGMDTMSAGNLCAFTIEAARRKKIDYKIDYGDVDAIAGLLEMIARREGVGDILARGIKFAASRWDLEDIAVHVKGLEPAAFDPRVLKGMALGYATSDRGACHLRGTFYKAELSGMIDRNVIEGKAELFLDFEHRLLIFDTLIFCRFYRDLYTWEKMGEVIHAVTGMNAEKKVLEEKARSIADLIRKFNVREGLKPEDDRLSKGLHLKLQDIGSTIREEDLETMVKDYYRLHGWDEDGLPLQ
ncbi:MAG: aldehyde ferredoxin oxidoreductase family protein [Deltaproteobacteria bacterium]|nr:aldehyde ferredoxin oxidoreductase family protein [Deltaproteobacteria bacterium]